MTVLTPADAPATVRRTDARPGTVLDAARVVARQHRTMGWLLGALTVLAVGALIVVRLRADGIAADFATTGCSVDNTTRACGGAVRSYFDSEWFASRLQTYLGLLLMALPAVFGAFMAGPAVGRELESGTYKLAWSQAVSPARWLAAKLAVPAAAAVTATLVLTAASAWYRPENQADRPYVLAWYGPTLYGSLGTVPFALALFGLAVGTLAGVLLRRTVAAMAATVVTVGAVVAGQVRFRSHLWPTEVYESALNTSNPAGFPTESWITWSGYVTADGTRITDPCGGLGEKTDIETCMDLSDVTGFFYLHHPESHFWPLQLVESGILLAAALVAVAVAFRLLRRLHG
ncbi:hypothetical protein [uncultured Streptomyces sp.]|uniref:hypothetical protein n=1 Tax=uncultured Streptomyces sp. TaxID=174707 RepID=UPI00262E40E0|nr:hypothetical protein [uncultured Streptomyces sp.]